MSRVIYKLHWKNTLEVNGLLICTQSCMHWEASYSEVMHSTSLIKVKVSSTLVVEVNSHVTPDYSIGTDFIPNALDTGSYVLIVVTVTRLFQILWFVNLLNFFKIWTILLGYDLQPIVKRSNACPCPQQLVNTWVFIPDMYLDYDNRSRGRGQLSQAECFTRSLE